MSTPTKDIFIFDRDRVRQNRERARAGFSSFNFLFEWTARQLLDRLSDITRSFDTALQIGSRTPALVHPKVGSMTVMDLCRSPICAAPRYIQASEEFLPLKPESLDLILSPLNLHTVNDLPGALLQIKRALKPDGLFLAAMLGGETLHELRDVFTRTELELFGGLSPRIAPFADKPQMGDLLQRAGFALPVIDSEIVTVTYPSVFSLLHDLRGMGEGNAIVLRQKTPTPRRFFLEAAARYAANYAHDKNPALLRASFEVIFLLGWSPHSTQQKPLKPGSAKHSLAAALGSTEIGLDDLAKP